MYPRANWLAIGGVFPFRFSFTKLGSAEMSAEKVSRKSLWVSGVPPIVQVSERRPQSQVGREPAGLNTNLGSKGSSRASAFHWRRRLAAKTRYSSWSHPCWSADCSYQPLSIRDSDWMTLSGRVPPCVRRHAPFQAPRFRMSSDGARKNAGSELGRRG